MELHQCLGWVESQSETPILGVLSALLRNFYWYSCVRIFYEAMQKAEMLWARRRRAESGELQLVGGQQL
jgi:hypothetical protein